MVNFTAVPERMALVNIDMQNLFVEGTPTGHATLGRINRLAAVCREARILVIHGVAPVRRTVLIASVRRLL
jgi:ureidoacrylate peracid hydrolase